MKKIAALLLALVMCVSVLLPVSALAAPLEEGGSKATAAMSSPEAAESIPETELKEDASQSEQESGTAEAAENARKGPGILRILLIGLGAAAGLGILIIGIRLRAENSGRASFSLHSCQTASAVSPFSVPSKPK